MSTSLFFVLLSGKIGDHAQVFQRRDVASDHVRGHDFTQEPAHDLAAARFGQGVGKADLLGAREGADLMRYPLAEFLTQFVVLAALAFLERHEAAYGLPRD